MKQDIENIIEKEFDLKYPDYGSDILSKAKTATEIAMAENEIFQRNKLKKFVYNITDEVLKVVVGKIKEIKTSKELKLKPLNDEYNQEYSYWQKGIKSDTREKLLKEYENGAKGNKMFSLQEKIEVLGDVINLLTNSITLEGERSEHLSPNKENKNK
jgi:hypothetical protein